MSIKQLGLLALVLQAVAAPAWANPFDWQTPPQETPDHFFIQSIPSATQGFDSWTIQSGYRYPLNNVSIYMGTQVKSENDRHTTQQGLLSGIEYRFTDKLRLSSQISRGNDDTLVNQWGVNSRYQLNESIDVNAGLDIEFRPEASPESVYQLGVGLHF
ncbi:hypothetical protein [Salinivibrio sharmensis]|uniref:Uncharacterized protein n=1 Tax=Salinivibrio sharmensis TaxID=390883 RepID=A0ABX3KK87_9GAMM|nr:hypothetical protein [Salinivibrio sharmensis]OOE90227.1 hypothetical protein BZG74_02695 [Salinivibrio sharmensis]